MYVRANAMAKDGKLKLSKRQKRKDKATGNPFE
jgi:hypothetical protein